jgi:hypothetical protein
VVAGVAHLGDEGVGIRVGGQQPPDADVGLGLEQRSVGRVNPRGRLQRGCRVGGRLREVQHVAGVHPAAGDVDPSPAVGGCVGVDQRVIEMGRAMQQRWLVAVAVGIEVAEDRADRALLGIVGDGQAMRANAPDPNEERAGSVGVSERGDVGMGERRRPAGRLAQTAAADPLAAEVGDREPPACQIAAAADDRELAVVDLARAADPDHGPGLGRRC